MAESNQPLTLSELENHLWESANILRGPVDAADFKTYIFPLLFFKRISDVYKAEWSQAFEESGGDRDFADFAENHRFQIPNGCFWDNVREQSKDIGRALQNAFRGIEQANPDVLYGIFGDAQWTNKERLSDALLRDLIEHFSELELANGNITATSTPIFSVMPTNTSSSNSPTRPTRKRASSTRHAASLV
jgi:type I restriction enzyme M protein